MNQKGEHKHEKTQATVRLWVGKHKKPQAGTWEHEQVMQLRGLVPAK